MLRAFSSSPPKIGSTGVWALKKRREMLDYSVFCTYLSNTDVRLEGKGYSVVKRPEDSRVPRVTLGHPEIRHATHKS